MDITGKFILRTTIPLLLALLWALPLFSESPIHITFAKDEAGKFPAGWVSRNTNNINEIYSVQVGDEKKFLHADARRTSVQIGYEKKWSLHEFPALQWEWRAVLFPVGTDERKKSGGDSVLGLYVMFGHWPFIKSIKYIWSDTLPVGTSFSSPFSKSSKMLVVRSGQSLIGQWVTEKRDVLSDYRQLFEDKEALPVASGIAILTDADNTNSRAIGDYANIQVLSAGEEKPAQPFK